jgi:two-component system sensor histidine kinase BaeS
VKTLFSKIFVAQVIAVVLALLVVTVLTRISLNRGFVDYLERQETAVLRTLAPALEEIYQSRGNWDFLRNNPRDWERIWRQTQSGKGNGPGPRLGGPRGQPPPRPESLQDAQLLRWMRSLDRPMLRNRLFLLDEQRSRVAGAPVSSIEGLLLEPLSSGETVIGWIGFTPMGKVLPPDAQRFLRGQIQLMVITFLIALGLAAVLAYLLARHLSRPLRRLSFAVNDLTKGRYEARARLGTGDEIGKLGKNVNQLAETLEKNRSARQRWMADIAHELRTPVAILKGEVEALTDGVRQADERMVVSLQEEIDQLTTLVDDLQTLALSDVGALNINKENLNLFELTGQLAETFRYRLAEREIRFEEQCRDGLIISGDPQRLRQLFKNLLENSCRYVEAGGRVRLQISQGPGEAEIRLEDSGPGVSDEQLQHLFDRFYRVEGSRARSSGGTGLGLSICRNIVEAHGGQIRAEHSGLGGLKIMITLPSE